MISSNSRDLYYVIGISHNPLKNNFQFYIKQNTKNMYEYVVD
jgi:hypothetical protein